MKLTLRTIIEAVAAFYELNYVDMMTYRQDTAKARHVAFWLARNLTDSSLPQIGKAFGGRDHTTIQHGIKRIDQLRKTDTRLALDLEELKQGLTALSDTLIRLGLSEKPDHDVKAIAEHVLSSRFGPTGISTDDIRTLAIAVITATEEKEPAKPEPEPEPEPAPPQFPLMVRAPPLYEPALAAFVAAHKELENAEHGRGERWAREQFDKAAARLAKAFQPTPIVSSERKAS